MAAKKKNANPLSKKTDWSITEFQMWLAGAYSLQGEDWIPNAEQWEMIVDIIYKLKDRGVAKKVVAVSPGPVLPPPGYGGPEVQPAMVSAAGPSMLGGDSHNPPFDPDEVPAEANMSLTQLNNAAKNGTLGSGQKAIKTPNIDTSKGYSGSFD